MIKLLLTNLKNTILLCSALTLSTVSFTQEICDNAIDDDNDGLIDLNDTTDCSCSLFDTIPAILIPNASFEDTLCCPDGSAQLNCAENWIQASDATSDYFNLCDYTTIVNPPNYPIPGNGSGYAGIISDTDYSEYIGTCLNGTMTAGTSYTLNFYTALATGSPALSFSLFGTTNCSDLPWTGTTCPDGEGNWQELISQNISYADTGTWQIVSLTFTPSVDISAIALGASCTNPGASNFNYYYIDELVLDSTINFGAWVINNGGNICENELELEANTTSTGGSWQWYLDGVALIGETDSLLDVSPYGTGNFTAVYTNADGCVDANSTTFEVVYPVADFSYLIDTCSAGASFTDLSTIAGGEIDSIWWSFGDTSSFTGFLFGSIGYYDVDLIVTSIYGCQDTTTQTLYIPFEMEADFTTTINQITYPASPGDTIFLCDTELLTLTDESTVSDPETLVGWNWDFSDGNFSSAQDTIYEYGGPGFYIIGLTVESSNGCFRYINQPILISQDPLVNYTITEGDGTVHQAMFEDTLHICPGETLVFENLSSIPPPDSIEYQIWNFGTGSNTGEDTTITYTNPGVYNINLNVITMAGCSHNETFTIIAEPLSAQVVDIINAICEGNNNGGATIANFTGIHSPYIVTWSDPLGNTFDIDIVNAGDSAFQTAMSTGTWNVTVENNIGCQWSTSLVIPPSIPPVTINTNVGHPQCFGTSTGSITAFSNVGDDLIFTILDSDNNEVNLPGTNTANSLSSGNYSIVYVDSLGCINSIAVPLIDPQPISIQLDLTHPLCHGFETGSAVVDTILNAQGNYNAISYHWTPNPNGDNGLFETENIGLVAGEYVLEISDDTGCTRQITYHIIDPNPLVGILDIESPTYCRTAAHQKGNGEVTVTTPGLDSSGTGNVTYRWENMVNGDTSTNTTFVVNEPGWMTATLEDANGCVFRDSIYVDSLNPIAYFEPISDQFEGPGEFEGTEDMTVEFINQSTNFSKASYILSDTVFQWNLYTNDPNQTGQGNWFFSFDYNEKIDTTYKGENEYLVCLVAKNFNDCKDTFCRVIEVHKFPLFDVPNVFTPGRNPNDKFYFPSQGIENFNCTIFNRYGLEVFRYESIEDQWDGRNAKNDLPCVEGVYFFEYHAISTNGTHFEGQGQVHLIRPK